MGFSVSIHRELYTEHKCITTCQKINYMHNTIREVLVSQNTTVSGHSLQDITDPLKINMNTQTFLDPAVIAKTIRHAHPALQKVIDYLTIHGKLSKNPSL